MKISLRNVSFSFIGKRIFDSFSADFENSQRPHIILGPSGSGKTTLLRLLGGLLKPQEGEIAFYGEEVQSKLECPRAAFIFQEPRLLPWLTILENVQIPLEKDFRKTEAKDRARHFISLVGLEEKENAYPKELSGGQAQRVSMARGFAWPATLLFMDEPFQSLDIPLKIHLMDLTLSLLQREPRLFIGVTHDPREALYFGGRIIILGGKPGSGIVYDRVVDSVAEGWVNSSDVARELEREMISALRDSYPP